MGSNLLNEVMPQLSSKDLAAALRVSKGRVSQYVSAGQLDGCFTGEGRARRFDLEKVCARLGKVLDPGQAMGNGASTKARIQAILSDTPEDDEIEPIPPSPVRAAMRDGAALPGNDTDRYELARIQKAEEEARKLRRQNLEAEGTFVLASAVRADTARLMAQEIAEFEVVLREGARAVADRLGVDAKQVRQILVDHWRSHRGRRASQLQAQSDASELSDAEKDADV